MHRDLYQAFWKACDALWKDCGKSLFGIGF